MSTLNSILILLVAFLAVFCESAFGGIRNLIGAQIDLLPALVVYAALSAGMPTITLVSVLGGLFFDSLSANPLGVSILPLFLAGFAIYTQRELILRDPIVRTNCPRPERKRIRCRRQRAVAAAHGWARTVDDLGEDLAMARDERGRDDCDAGAVFVVRLV